MIIVKNYSCSIFFLMNKKLQKNVITSFKKIYTCRNILFTFFLCIFYNKQNVGQKFFNKSTYFLTVNYK